MNRVAIGILAVLLVAGCAMEAGAPPDEGLGSQPGEVAAVPAIRQNAGPVGSAGPQRNPEPSPWHGDPNANPGSDGTGDSPEPSPWHQVPNATVQGPGTGPQSGPSSGKNTGATTAHPPHIGHWDLKDVTAAQ